MRDISFHTGFEHIYAGRYCMSVITIAFHHYMCIFTCFKDNNILILSIFPTMHSFSSEDLFENCNVVLKAQN